GADDLLYALVRLDDVERGPLALGLDRRAGLRLRAMHLLLLVGDIGVVRAWSGRLYCVCHRRNSKPASIRVGLLQSLCDLLKPAKLHKACPAYDHSSCEREPWLEGPSGSSEPVRARCVDLRSGSFTVGYL